MPKQRQRKQRLDGQQSQQKQQSQSQQEQSQQNEIPLETEVYRDLKSGAISLGEKTTSFAEKNKDTIKDFGLFNVYLQEKGRKRLRELDNSLHHHSIFTRPRG